MATLQKFKLFATRCGVEQSPTLSPRTSPLVHLTRPKTTLRTLLGLSLTRPPRRQEHVSVLELEKKEKDPMRRHSLKDLFVSSPPKEEEALDTSPMLGSVAVGNMGLGRSNSWKIGPGSTNPVWTGFRCRSLLKRKAWRPMLLAISEQWSSIQCKSMCNFNGSTLSSWFLIFCSEILHLIMKYLLLYLSPLKYSS